MLIQWILFNEIKEVNIQTKNIVNNVLLRSTTIIF